jgi:plastocyanin
VIRTAPAAVSVGMESRDSSSNWDPTPPSSTGRTRPKVGAVRFLPAALVALLVAIAIPLVGCGGGGGTDSTSAATSGSASASSAKQPAVTIVDYTYEPATISVPAGTAVEFSNEDSTPHTATSKQSGAFETGSIDTGKSAKVILEKPGTYAYYCAFHPFMKGSITVE